MFDAINLLDAADAGRNLLEIISQAVELGCDEKTEWTELLKARRTANYKNELFESATRTVVYTAPALSSDDKKKLTTNILLGDLAAGEISGELLLNIAKVFVRLIWRSARARG